MNSQHWEDWIVAHGTKLALYARRWASDHAEAEDLVQEAFVRFWQTRGEVRDPLAYLYQCVRNVAIDISRSNQARTRREASVMTKPNGMSPAFANGLDDQERRQRIEAALSELPVEQAEVVTLKIWSALTFAQIAKITATPPGTVASRYRYAMGRLRQTLVKSELT